MTRRLPVSSLCPLCPPGLRTPKGQSEPSSWRRRFQALCRPDLLAGGGPSSCGTKRAERDVDHEQPWEEQQRGHQQTIHLTLLVLIRPSAEPWSHSYSGSSPRTIASGLRSSPRHHKEKASGAPTTHDEAAKTDDTFIFNELFDEWCQGRGEESASGCHTFCGSLSEKRY